MYIKDEWISRNLKILKILKPNMSETKLLKFLDKKFEENFKDTEAKIYNSYDEIVIDTTLAKTIDWVQIEKPYISESGCFFKNRYKCRNLNAEIMEGQLDRRVIRKREMFEAKQAGDVILEAFKDICQGNEKKRANSGYGAEGNHTSFLFNAHSAISITAAGRSSLSVAGMCFENLFANFVKFKNIDELYTYLYNITIDKKHWKYSIDEVIDIIPSKSDFINNLKEKFDTDVKYDEYRLEEIYDNLSKDMRIRVYYTSNMKKFLKNTIPRDLIRDIMKTPSEFVDPNKIPKDIAPLVLVFNEIVTEFVGYRYQHFRYEDRMKADKKANIVVSDTDSTFLYLGDIVRYVMNNLLPIKLFKNKDVKKSYRIKLVNLFCVLGSTAASDALYNYLDKVNVEDDFKSQVNMKNEYYLEIVGVTFAKKSYFGILSRKEGFIYSKPKLEVKGVNFFKSTSTEKTTKFIYDEILMKRIFDTKTGEIDIKSIVRKIKEYENMMYKDIKNGDMGYYKKSVKVKSQDAYVDPMKISAYKATYVWNSLVDFSEQISFPAVTTSVKVNIKTIKDLAPLEKYPEIFEKFVYLLEKDKNLQRIDSKGKSKFIGIKSIALPYGTDKVPDWLLELIDIETIISDNMKLFTQLYRPLGFKPGTNSHNGTQIKYYTNIIKL